MADTDNAENTADTEKPPFQRLSNADAEKTAADPPSPRGRGLIDGRGLTSGSGLRRAAFDRRRKRGGLIYGSTVCLFYGLVYRLAVGLFCELVYRLAVGLFYGPDIPFFRFFRFLRSFR